MDARQEAKDNMYDAVITLCGLKENEPAIKSVPAVGTAITLLTTKQAEIRANAALQLDKKTGAAGKSQSRLGLNALTLTVAQALYAFASSTKEDDLLQKSKYTKSSIKAIRDEDIKQVAENLHGWAFDLITSLGDFGITTGLLATHQKLIDDYSGKISSPAITKAAKKTAGQNIVRLFKEADLILKTQIDPLVDGMITTFPAFRTNYFNVRQIIDPSGSKTLIAGIITDAKNDNVPIPNATVTLITVNLPKSAPAGTPIPPPLTFKTKADGTFKFPAKPQTDYTLKAEGTLFIPKSIEFVQVKLGTTKTVDIGLMPS